MYPAFQALSGKRVILASQSPRRQQIFCSVGFTPEFVPSGFPEDFDWRPFGPRDYVSFNAKKKVEWISDGLYGGEKEPVLIVGCDTVVSCDEQVLEKARDREHAAEMLRMISGKVLRIYSGVYIQYRGKDGALKEANFVDVVQVRMRQYDDAIINGYLDLGYGLDHAGALAIQDGGAILVEGIDGDFYSAVGFPMSHFYSKLESIIHDIA